MDDIAEQIARQLHEGFPGNATRPRPAWSQLSLEQRTTLMGLSNGIMAQVMDGLIRLAERDDPTVEDIAESAAYWLIEMRDRLLSTAAGGNLLPFRAAPPGHHVPDHQDGSNPGSS